MALLTDPLLHQQGQVARAGADVQYIMRLGTAGGFFSREVLAEQRSKGLVAADAACAGRRRREVFDCCVLPAVVQSEAQQRVVEVVEPGDRGEHLLNGLFLGLPRPIGNSPGWGPRHRPLLRLKHSDHVAPAPTLCQVYRPPPSPSLGVSRLMAP